MNAAGGHLKQVFGQEPREATAKARWGVVKAWHQDYTMAADYLSEVAEKEPATLDFLIGLMQMSQRKRVAEVITSANKYVLHIHLFDDLDTDHLNAKDCFCGLPGSISAGQ